MTNTPQIPSPEAAHNDDALLSAAVAAVQSAGSHLTERFSTDAPSFRNLSDIVKAIDANDEASLAFLREPLLAARPGSQWAEDELEGGELPPGEWWITDPVEGNINHIHGMADWCVTATMVRDNVPVLTAIHLPLTGNTYTAVRGHGAWLDGVRLHPSKKTDLNAALVGTGQAMPGESADTFRRIGHSVTAMLEAGLVLRVSVPATLQLIHVAAGRMDVFWQYSQVRSGLVAGALLVEEAGGAISDTHGRPWNLASEDFLAAAPSLHSAAVIVLSTIP
jgi:myo-inositol-1(or 4)-monophosphatase